MSEMFVNRFWNKETSAVFSKTKEKWGGLSNFAGGYPIVYGGLKFWNSEALYQSCRFTENPEIQEQIANEKNPMKAKWLSRKHIHLTRPDWEEVKVSAMELTIRQKFLQNISFRKILLETGDMDIVEFSKKDSFWGAKPTNEENVLFGMNVLGIVLMNIRKEYRI